MTSSPTTRSAEGAALTSLILETFRLNGRLLAEGDRLARPFHLSSALWQVVGALDEGPLPVAHIARNMGLRRQSLHRTVERLVQAGLVELLENPHHRRAMLVSLTPRGRAALDRVTRAQVAWVDTLAAGLPARDLGAALRVLRTVRERLEER
jgi:DNA-binding MarR family transcriptional regulator